MEYIVVSLVAFFASMLTFFSGFGLGTLLLPVFAFFFSVEEAIAVTGVVHLLNNLFKLGLVGKDISKSVALKFGVPAILGALIGAWGLIHLSGTASVYEGEIMGLAINVKGINLTIGIVLIAFALYDIIPALRDKTFSNKWLIPGGLISGFFGGLSGHQGALRSAFLINLGLSKEAFIGTGVAIACFVDFTRIPLYAGHIMDLQNTPYALLIVAVLSAFLGAWLGKKFLTKMSLPLLHLMVAYMMMAVAIGMIAGWL
ncbi:MAG: sulfite exporter TauE/SafE family protein [Flavobacteriales bacterium]|nr:sulfite exporter TauE/SafE family protein [Flavobacteriales bacterium]